MKGLRQGIRRLALQHRYGRTCAQSHYRKTDEAERTSALVVLHLLLSRAKYQDHHHIARENVWVRWKLGKEVFAKGARLPAALETC